MEQQELMNKKLGNKEIPRLTAKEVTVLGLRVETVGEKKNQIVMVTIKHPDSDKTMEITKIKISKNEKLKVVGLWYSLDEDGNIQKGSALDSLMQVAEVSCLGDLVGKNLPTVEESKELSYLCFKSNY